MGLSDQQLRQLNKIVRYANALGLSGDHVPTRVRRTPAEKSKMCKEIVAALENGAKAKDLARHYNVSLPYIYILKTQEKASVALATNLGGLSGFAVYFYPLM